MNPEWLARLTTGGTGDPFYLPDLTLWYEGNRHRGTLPPAWQDRTLPEICRALGVPAWLPVRPWKMEIAGADVGQCEQGGERITRYETSAGILIARWSLGPDGDWWQTEYPVKSPADLPAALALVQARTYHLDSGGGVTPPMKGDAVSALEIPRRPYSDLLHELLGWSEGLLLLTEPLVREMAAALEGKLQALVAEIATLPGDLVFSPDNLDGQYISPRAFKGWLGASYRRSAETLRQAGKRLLVHAGGAVRNLLAPLAEAGVDGVEGVAGPPQSNATLAEARQIAGPGLTLWGGIPQDLLLSTHEWAAFEATVREAVTQARGDGRIILGVADRVPVDADLERLEVLPDLIAGRR